MRTVSFERVIKGVADLAGLRRDNISTTEFRILRDFISDRLMRAWEHDFWPDLTRTEKRYFRPLWDSTTTYAATTEVFYPSSGKYYQSLQGSNLNNAPADANDVTDQEYWADVAAAYSASDYDNSTAYARGDQVYYGVTDRYYQLHAATSTGNLPTDTANWGVLTEFEKSIDLEQTGETAIGFVQELWEVDPWKDIRAQALAWMLTNDKITVLSDTNKAWVEFRIRNPILSGETYSSTTAYSSGDQVYFETGVDGNFYDANQSTSAGESPTSASSKWDIVEIPLIFERYLEQGAFADYLSHLGQADKSALWHRIAESHLHRQSEVLSGNQGQRVKTVVLTR